MLRARCQGRRCPQTPDPILMPSHRPSIARSLPYIYSTLLCVQREMHTLHARSSIVDVYNGSVVQMLGAETLTFFLKIENTVPPPSSLLCVWRGGDGRIISSNVRPSVFTEALGQSIEVSAYMRLHQQSIGAYSVYMKSNKLWHMIQQYIMNTPPKNCRSLNTV